MGGSVIMLSETVRGTVRSLLGRRTNEHLQAHVDTDGVFFVLECDSGAFATAEYSPNLDVRRFVIEFGPYLATYDFGLRKVIVSRSDTDVIVHCSALETPVFESLVLEQFRLALYVELFG